MAQARSAIRFARDSPGRAWCPEHIAEAQRHPTGDLHCGGCSAPVTAFRETTLRTNTVRSAHFKLKASRDRANTHDPDCTFHLQTAVATLLRDTQFPNDFDAVAVRRPAGPPGPPSPMRRRRGRAPHTAAAAPVPANGWRCSTMCGGWSPCCISIGMIRRRWVCSRVSGRAR